MKFRIPYTLSSNEVLKRRIFKTAQHFHGRKSSSLNHYLKISDSGFTQEEYIAIVYTTLTKSFIVLSLLFTLIFYFIDSSKFYLYGLGAGILFSVFLYFNQLNYPKVYANKKSRDIDKNLIAMMQDMSVQLNSGVPLFKILVNIASSDYGVISQEFALAVKEINSGKPQLQAIDDLGNRTSSLYFRRILWQISNGMRAGSDMNIVIRDNIDNLEKEQNIQIQNYGSRLNPLVMFYMLITVIMPALALTFLTIISSLLNLSSTIMKLFFAVIFIVVVLVQIVFLGTIRTRRPSLL